MALSTNLQFSKINPVRSGIVLNALRNAGPPLRPLPARLKFTPNVNAPQVIKSSQILPGRGQA